jgi:hypothetical protein
MTGAESRRALRADVLRSCGASPALVEELLAYGAAPEVPAGTTRPAFPLPDEPHIESWLSYEREAKDAGVFAALARHFIQLRFPIRAGVSEADAYRQATRKGVFSAADAFAPGLVLSRPDDLALTISPTMAGRIPVLVAGDRADFVALIQAFTERNEPAPVPPAMGACIVKGLNNWSRIAAYRDAWTRERPDATDEDWNEEFRQLIPHKVRYQDRMILLSRGPYSGIAAADIGFDEDDWLARSLVLRREHEFTHYFTYRVFGIMRNHVFDELVADFVGLVRALGRYRADLALRFLGLEDFPRYRQGGRLEVYRGQPPLSDEAFAVVRALAVRAAANLERLGEIRGDSLQDLASLGQLTFDVWGLSLEELASAEMPALL